MELLQLPDRDNPAGLAVGQLRPGLKRGTSTAGRTSLPILVIALTNAAIAGAWINAYGRLPTITVPLPGPGRCLTRPEWSSQAQPEADRHPAED